MGELGQILQPIYASVTIMLEAVKFFKSVISTDLSISCNKSSNYCNQLKSVAITDCNQQIGYCD